MTREYKRLDEFISDFQQASDNSFPDSVLQTKAQDLVTLNEKMRKYRDELESISSELTRQMWECLNNELDGNSPEDAVDKVYEDVDSYVSRYKKLVNTNALIIDKAIVKSKPNTAPSTVISHPGSEQSLSLIHI